jgi:copper chaperone CopZ
VSVAVKKVNGVDTIEVSLEKASAVITLKEGNAVSLPELRRVIRNSGYPTRDAQVTARGRIVERSGTRVVDLLNGTTLAVANPSDVTVSDAVVEISGVSQAAGTSAERIRVTKVR